MTERIIHMRYGEGAELPATTGEVTTLLWQNSNPSSSFSAQNVSLSKSAEGFQYLRIVWRNSTADDTLHIVEYDMSNKENYLSGSSHARMAFSRYGETYRFDRSAYFTNENYDTLYFYNAIRVTTTSSNVGSNTGQCIPVEIYGVNIGKARNYSGSSWSGETYTGAYNVTPKANEQTVLSTAGKIMTRNVTVFEVPYYETSNEQGGYTAYIAQEVE